MGYWKSFLKKIAVYFSYAAKRYADSVSLKIGCSH